MIRYNLEHGTNEWKSYLKRTSTKWEVFKDERQKMVKNMQDELHQKIKIS